MRRVGDAYRAAGVAAIYLAHGTMAGTDMLGLLGEMERFFPGLSNKARATFKQLVDAIAGDAGNYTAQYALQLEDALNQGASQKIPVYRFLWSSENHHLGRADAAVRLIDELARQKFTAGQRVLLWGHSHAGNVFALATNLLAADREALDEFFAAARVYYIWPYFGWIDLPLWRATHEALLAGNPLGGAALDVVTFGTPIRYGWDTAGYGKLLHFVCHRPRQGWPEWREAFPPKLEDVLAGTGDFIQQLGIAGTNWMPSIIACRAVLADRRLGRLLQRGMEPATLQERLRCGQRVPADGRTLLVDYGPPQGNVVQHLAGHAVYTRPEWMLFHCEEVARCFYGDIDAKLEA
jgi:hypothetical protein